MYSPIIFTQSLPFRGRNILDTTYQNVMAEQRECDGIGHQYISIGHQMRGPWLGASE